MKTFTINITDEANAIVASTFFNVDQPNGVTLENATAALAIIHQIDPNIEDPAPILASRSDAELVQITTHLINILEYFNHPGFVGPTERSKLAGLSDHQELVDNLLALAQR